MAVPAILALVVLPRPTLALELHPEIAVEGWFMAAKGTVNGTDLEALGFDHQRAEPEFRVGLGIGEGHEFAASYLRIRRSESGIVTGHVLGVLRVQDPISLDVALDDVRFRYGYALVANDWIRVAPFFELGYEREESTTVERNFARTSHQSDSAVLPLPGVEAVFAEALPVRLAAGAEGIAFGRGHLLDVHGGAELVLGAAFAGIGYRHVNALFQHGSGSEIADVELDGAYLEAGLRFQ